MLCSDALAQSATSVNSAIGSTNNAMQKVFDFSKLNTKSVEYYIDYETALEEYNTLDGSPFLEDRTILADLYLPDGRYTPNVNIKYDLYNNEIIAWKNNKKKIILDLSDYSKIVGIGLDKNLVLEKSSLLEKDKFYEVLFKRDDFVFFKENIKVISNHTSQMPGLQHQKKKFTNKAKYHIQRGDNIYEFKLGEKHLDNIPDFKGVDIKKELKKVDMKKLKNESHFIQFFDKIFDYLVKPDPQGKLEEKSLRP